MLGLKPLLQLAHLEALDLQPTPLALPELQLALNRWLKLKPPAERIRQAVLPVLQKALPCEQTCWQQLLGKLPLFYLEALCFEAMAASLPPSTERATETDRHLQHRVLTALQEMEAPSVRLHHDWQCLQQHGHWLSLHGAEWAWPPGPGWYRAWAERLQVPLPAHFQPLPAPNAWLKVEGSFEVTAAAWQQALWQASAVLPWEALLADCQAFPYLSRLKAWLALEDPTLEPSSPLAQTPSYKALALSPLAKPSASMPEKVWPVKRLLLVEGPTETLLLPALAQALGQPLAQQGLLVKSMGGKPQAQRVYQQFSEWFAGPITLLLDADAQTQADTLAHELRPQDTLIVNRQGELEDELDEALWLATLNQALEPYPALTPQLYQSLLAEAHFPPQASRLEALKALCLALKQPVLDKMTVARQMVRLLQSQPQLAQPHAQWLAQLSGRAL